MKKLVSLIIISIMLITMSTMVWADESVLGDNNNNPTPITPDEYENAQVQNNSTNNLINNTNTNNNSSDKLPQTGIEDSGVGVLMIICVASAIFAYKKVSDYRNI